MKLIFLDIDGVLNCRHTKERKNGIIDIDPFFVDVLNWVLDETDARIVLSSTWRFDENWHETMKNAGIKDVFIGRTGRSSKDFRGDDIQDYLDEHHKEIDTYIIIDDDSDFYPWQPHAKTSFFEDGIRDVAADAIFFLKHKKLTIPLGLQSRLRRWTSDLWLWIYASSRRPLLRSLSNLLHPTTQDKSTRKNLHDLVKILLLGDRL